MSIIVKAMVAAETLIENIRVACESLRDGDTYKTSSLLPNDIVVTRTRHLLKWCIGNESVFAGTVLDRLTQAYIEDVDGSTVTGAPPIILQVGDVVRCLPQPGALLRDTRLRFDGLSVIHQVNLEGGSICYSTVDQAWFQRHELEFVEASSPDSIDYLFRHLAANEAEEEGDEDEDGDSTPAAVPVHSRSVPNWRDDLTPPVAPEHDPDYDI